MSQPPVNPEFVERYQLELEKNPRSRVFAPLAEAYRKMGLLDEALRICKIGVMANPDFAGGRVAYAKALLETKAFADALTQLEKATRLSPDNLLAHMLMGETLIELRKPKDALKAFKMVLFLNPDDERARQAVKKWEFLTAEEFDEEVFAMRPVFRAGLPLPRRDEPKTPSTEQPNSIDEEPDDGSEDDSVSPNKTGRQRDVERAVSLADAFTVRNDLVAAIEVLESAQRVLGPSPEIQNRIRLLSRRTAAMAEAEADDENESTGTDVADSDDDADEQTSTPTPTATSTSASLSTSTSVEVPRAEASTDRQKMLLESILRRINDRRLS